MPVRSVPLIGTPSTSSTSELPLAARRGKAVSGLQLKEKLMEEMDYPDIPTAFRGSPSVWSPQFDVRLPGQPFTDHQSMLSNLRSKCAVLASGLSTPIEYPWEDQEVTPETPYTTLGSDEWAFARELASFEDDFEGLVDAPPQVPQRRSHWSQDEEPELVADSSTFAPYECSTPVKPAPTLQRRLRPQSSMPGMRSPASKSSGPPGVPLPPRPALVNPATPLHVRGILKKAKSVRFEDMLTNDLHDDQTLYSAPPTLGVALERPSPLRQSFTAASERPTTPSPNRSRPPPKSSAKVTAVAVTPAQLKSPAEKKPAPRPRLVPKTIVPPPVSKPSCLSQLPALRPRDNNVERSVLLSKPAALASVERSCRVKGTEKENASPAPTPQAQRKPRWSIMNESDLRRGLEGAPKSRLSTPLRNMFRFK
ncbi:hypothetical protein HYDPIDRAFT_110750 [Hydnomerulius pinastri MD-312]|nr:hypothetical protein HYDPIDRAFT_110750 [Hydnomerulius pinastri MD-312]